MTNNPNYTKGQHQRQNPITRRDFVSAAGATVAGSILCGMVPYEESLAAERDICDYEADVIVVGCGAAGPPAALFAKQQGASVLMLEKGPVFGGTLAKSEGGFWIPNNKWMRELGLIDERGDALKYMVRVAYPAHYNPHDKYLGLSENDYNLLASIYENGAITVEELHKMGAVNVGLPPLPDGKLITDYFFHLPENKAGRGRTLMSMRSDSEWPGNGAELTRQLKTAVDAADIPVLYRHRALRLVQNNRDEVVGLEVQNKIKRMITIRANRGVVFATGGFTHNKEYRKTFLPGSVYGGCSVPTNTGDFLSIAMDVGASLGNLSSAWWSQLPLEPALENSTTATGIWVTPGDSAIQVNRYGKRFCNEKFVYNERTKAHFSYNPVRGEFDHLITVLIFDQRSRGAYAGRNPIPEKGTTAEHLMMAGNLSTLTKQIEIRLATLANHTGNFTLAPEFTDNLQKSIKQYNQYAIVGRDDEFGRGTHEIEHTFHGFASTDYSDVSHYDNPFPNQTMHPLSDSGPFYAILLAAGTLDTKGGPRINADGAVLDSNGDEISGLYAAGNCVAHPAGDGYWGPGSTIGPAFIMGRSAGLSAATAKIKTLS